MLLSISGLEIHLNFMNRSNRTVYLFWLDYRGNLVRYGDMPPYKGIQMNTYVTHPWVALDATTGYPLTLNGERVFYPQAERNGQIFHVGNSERVSISIPVYSLYRRCLEVVFLKIPSHIWDKENIPGKLKSTLNNIKCPDDFIDCRYFHQTHYDDVPRDNDVAHADDVVRDNDVHDNDVARDIDDNNVDNVNDEVRKKACIIV